MPPEADTPLPQLFYTNGSEIPSVPGAYVLAIDIGKSVTVTIPGRPRKRLPPGRYLYCGSAWGPGGLRARLARHMRRGKTIRWHVDRLTEAGAVVGAWVLPGGDECDLAGALSRLPVPLAGFGSTDCTRCRSHLFYWPDAKHSGPDRELILFG
jgi:Uri superfamily endonuclease